MEAESGDAETGNGEKAAGEAKAGAEEDEGEDGDQSVLVSILTFDFNELIFGGKDFTARSAWAVVLLETLVIAAACYILAEAVMLSAKALGVQVAAPATLAPSLSVWRPGHGPRHPRSLPLR